MPTSLVRPIKRFLVFAGEFGVLVFGFGVSFVLTAYLNPSENSLALPVFYAGLILAVVGFVVIRRKTRPWKIKYDAVGWALARRLHPTRARYKGIAMEIIGWVPSMIAALVLFFFPVATHLVHPHSQYLAHYRVPIPWTFSVFSSLKPPADSSTVLAYGSGSGRGRFGLTAMWDRPQLLSEMMFIEFNHEVTLPWRGRTNQVTSREVRLGSVALSCWQQESSPTGVRSGAFGTRVLWVVTCETPVEVRQHFYASFFGPEEDMPAFYKVIEGVKPVN